MDITPGEIPESVPANRCFDAGLHFDEVGVDFEELLFQLLEIPVVPRGDFRNFPIGRKSRQVVSEQRTHP
jgi:hypothetical protein